METNGKEKSNLHYYYLDLLKAPISTLCVVIGLTAVCLISGIDLSRISKISTTGIELLPEKTQQLTADMETSINLLKAEIEGLKSQLAEVSTSSNSKPASSISTKPIGGINKSTASNPTQNTDGSPSTTAPSENTAQYKAATDRLLITELVNNPTIASISYIDKKKNTSLKGEEGYIWLGQYDGKEWLTEAFLNNQDNTSSTTIEPEKMRSRQYLLSQSMRLWETNPAIMIGNNDNNKMIGIVPSEIPVKILSVAIKDQQCWALVEVLK